MTMKNKKECYFKDVETNCVFIVRHINESDELYQYFCDEYPNPQNLVPCNMFGED